MSEDDVTAALQDTLEHWPLHAPVLTALTGAVPAHEQHLVDAILADQEHWTWSAPKRHRGPDLVLAGAGDVKTLALENKLAGGKGHVCPITYCTTGTLAPGAEATGYAQMLTAAIADPTLMPFGAEPHDVDYCCSNWAGGWHQGEVVGVPQIDYYAYYSDWHPDWLQPAPAEDVVHIFLSGGPVTLTTLYPGAYSAHRWTVVTYPDLLTATVTNLAAAAPLPAAADAAVGRLYTALHQEMTWRQVADLPLHVQHELTRRGLPLEPAPDTVPSA